MANSIPNLTVLDVEGKSLLIVIASAATDTPVWVPTLEIVKSPATGGVINPKAAISAALSIVLETPKLASVISMAVLASQLVIRSCVCCE